ncbi:MAG: hypothetical protein ABEJ03_03350 [Candidatus Nanohaloarchaea archaeon]
MRGRKARIGLAVLFLVVQVGTATAAENASDSSDINLEIGARCKVITKDFIPPNDGVLGRGRTGSFFALFENRGSLNATLEARTLNLSYMNRTTDEKEYLNLSLQQDIYDSYNPLVDYGNYTENLSIIGPESRDEYAKLFSAVDEYDLRTYNATLYMNTTCSGFADYTIEKSFNVTDQLTIVNSSGGVSEIGNRTTNRTFPANVTELGQEETPQTIPGNATRYGNATTNQTLPRNVNRTGGRSNLTVPRDANRTGGRSNRTVPQDVNRTGGEANRSVEGRSSDNPGSFPRPILELEPENQSITAVRSRFARVKMNVRNLGDIPVTDLTISPLLSKFEGGWEAQNASVENISSGENTSRLIHIKPPSTAEPGRYIVPVSAYTSRGRADLDFVHLDVRKENFQAKISVLEAPRQIRLEAGQSQVAPVLIENTGKRKLSNVSLDVQNLRDCAEVTYPEIGDLGVNETASVPLQIRTASAVSNCNSTIMVSSEEGAFAFSKMRTDIVEDEGVIPREQRPPFIALLWTAVLSIYAVVRRRYSLDSTAALVPLVLLIAGEAVILSYMVAKYYGLISLPFMPF